MRHGPRRRGGEKLAGAGLLAGGSAKKDSDTWESHGRFGAVAGFDGRIGTQTTPGVFAQIGQEYGHKYGGTSFELFARISEKNHGHSTLNPLAAHTKRMTLDEIMNDLMISYPNTRRRPVHGGDDRRAQRTHEWHERGDRLLD